MKENILKATLALTFTGLTAYFQILLVPFALLLVVMVCDYASGMIVAWITKSLSSRIGIVGIIKKLCYLLTVTVGMVVDWVIQSALLHVGVEMQNGVFIFGVLVTVWLIINELLSILENLTKIGVPLPPFLSPLIKRLKSTVEKNADKKTKDNETNQV